MAALLLPVAACISPLQLFNPEFLADVGLGSPRAANLPGDAPALLVYIENRTARNAEVQIAYRSGDATVETFNSTITAGTRSGQALVCPITEITLGELGNLESTGAIIRLGNGGDNDPFISVEPFGVVLQEGVNYDCGDAITFAVIPSGATASGFQTIAYIQRADQ